MSPLALLLAAPALLLPSDPPTGDELSHAAVVAPDVGERLDAWLSGLERFGLHGAVLVAAGERVVLRKGYGVADHGEGRPITASTIFDLGSLGKQFVATAVLRLAADGKLALDDTLDAHLDGVPEDKRAITIHQLLSHTAGLPYMPGTGSPLDVELIGEPGGAYAYSNVGYSLAARVIDEVAGEPFEEFVRRELFAKHGLVNTRFRGDTGYPDDCARAYTDETAQGAANESLGPMAALFRGAGGVTSCLEDLWTWERALRTNAVLPPEWTEKLFAEHVVRSPLGLGYGYGWNTAKTERGTRVAFHGGNFGGFNVDYRRYLEEGRTIVFLSNHFANGRSMRDAVMNDLSRMLNGQEVSGPPSLVPWSAEELDAVAGRYRDQGGAEVTLVRDGEDLLARGHDPEAMDVLFAPWMEAAEREEVRTLEANATAIVDGVFANDSAALFAVISPSLPREGAWGALRASAVATEAELGEFRACTVVGSAVMGSPNAVRTVVRVEHERGSPLFSITWSGGRAIHLASVEEPPTLRLAPVTETELSSYDLFTRAATRVTVVGPNEIAIATSEGPRRFRR